MKGKDKITIMYIKEGVKKKKPICDRKIENQDNNHQFEPQ